jgi:hypothetical protein
MFVRVECRRYAWGERSDASYTQWMMWAIDVDAKADLMVMRSMDWIPGWT